MTLKAFEALNMGLGKSLVCMQNNIPVLVSAPTLLSLSEQLRITQGGSRRKPLARRPVAQGNNTLHLHIHLALLGAETAGSRPLKNQSVCPAQ